MIINFLRLTIEKDADKEMQTFIMHNGTCS